ncbi:hypothetical protein ABBQ32_002935 [Trebouxia sp. C0010 RCD-2024]
MGSMATAQAGHELLFWERSPPLAILAAAEIAQVSIEVRVDPNFTKDSLPILLLHSDREELEGGPSILRLLARTASEGSVLYGANALSAVQVSHRFSSAGLFRVAGCCVFVQVDQWLDFSDALVSSAGLEAVCGVIDQYLSLRTYIVGYQLSIADLQVWGQLQASLQWEKIRKSGKLPHLTRWYDFLSQTSPLKGLLERHAPKKSAAAERVKEAAAAGKGSAKGTTETGSFEIGLQDAVQGKVVTRFPPEPSGYLHIGHAKAALLNQYFAQKYKGRMLMRFDDTNPSKEKEEFSESIIRDTAVLGVTYDKLTHTSDYFSEMLDLAERLIKKGFIYADDTPLEQMRAERGEGIESKCRQRPVEENLAIWKEMVAGSPVGLTNCMRFKISVDNPNKAMRDPVAYRCNLIPHIRTGSKYKVYPTYDCACPFVDALEGVTHALRTSEYKDREDQFYWVLRAQQQVWPGLPWVHIWDYSRLSFINTVLSKRKLTWFVQTGLVEGWADPRMPTVQGVIRRGMQVSALRDFILSQGASKNVTVQEWDKIWTMNKKVIDPVCGRHTAVLKSTKVLLKLSNGPEEPQVMIVPRHKKFEGAGRKATTKTKEVWLDQEDVQLLKEGEEVTLMDWGNAVVQAISRSEDGKTITGAEGQLHLEGSVKSTKWKLHWLPNIAELVPLRLVDFDHLITKKKLEEGDALEDFVNKKSRWEVDALGDANLRKLQKGKVIQLERKGYFIIDQPFLKAQPMVLFAIPDGKQQAIIPRPTQ